MNSGIWRHFGPGSGHGQVFFLSTLPIFLAFDKFSGCNLFSSAIISHSPLGPSEFQWRDGLASRGLGKPKRNR
jgi:hypothetical protein